jgi:hypothetical protein
MKFALVAVLFIGAGCGKTIQPAGGKVLVDGVPVKDGAVTFYPVEPGRAASASIMEDGSFTLSFDNPNDGLPPGAYKVTIVADVWKDTVSPEQKKALEAVLKKQGAIDDPALLSAGTLIHIVPPEYNDIATTPLRETVAKSSQPLEFVFDIPSKKKKK